MLRDVLVVKRLEENKFPIQIAPVDVSAIATECAMLLEPNSVAVGVAVRVDIELAVPPVAGDEALLTRMIMNLVSNSLKFTPRGGEVTIGLRCVSDTEVEGVVADTGIGIPAGQLTRIFDKYVQVEDKQARSGLGLGLAFCRQAIEAHKGRIWAEANKAKGTRFFPVADQRSGALVCALIDGNG